LTFLVAVGTVLTGTVLTGTVGTGTASNYATLGVFFGLEILDSEDFFGFILFFHD